MGNIISCEFDGGNIEVADASDASDIQLTVRRDNQADFMQWFYFSLEGEIGQTCHVSLTNAGQTAYPKGWENYSVCTSWDRQNWFRTPCSYEDGVLSFDIELQQSAVYFAYFAPYSHERHLDLIAFAQQDTRTSAETLGQTVDGRALHLLRICETDEPTHKVWIIARQHPGETMAEWFMEGLINTLLDDDNPLACKLLQTTAFYLVPNMNPDGAFRGNLRTNAAGANLNREWAEPSMEKSPEVFLVRERMMAEGGNLFLDVHGDEALPYNFVSGCEGIPGYTERHAELEMLFKDTYMAVSPDFQDEHGYPKDKPGKANMTMASNWLVEQFKTLAYTLEMPFKDNADLPNAETGWSPQRAAQLGSDVLFPVGKVLVDIARDQVQKK